MQLNEDLLIQYALDLLDQNEKGAVDEALSGSAELRDQLYEIRETMNALALAESPMQPDPRIKTRILTSIEPSTRFEGFTERFAEMFDLVESKAREVLAKIDSAQTGEWKSTLLPGIDILKFTGGPRVAGMTCGLIFVKPNTQFPRHQHRAEERVLVLQGRARENSGRLLQPGDLLISEAQSNHSFLTLGPEPFVFAVSLSKKVRWLILRSLIDRLFRKSLFREPDSG